jgi:midasin (ATPase involved in ribosome maturation)
MVVFEFFGDSNIAKAWKAVASDQERLKGSVLRQTTTKVSLRDNLKTVAQTTRHLLVSALSNPISRLKFEGVVLLGQSVTELLDEIFDFLVQTLNNNPELKVHLCMATFRDFHP